MPREFTYNTGSAIAGTNQIEDLAVGVTAQEYYLKPGDALWWMGPDESGLVIIAKDVPTQDHPSPVGDIGNCEFWGGPYSRELFIEIASKLPERAGLLPFDDDDEAYDWVTNNGYWTNYSYSPPAQKPWHAGLQGYYNPSSLNQGYGTPYLNYSTGQDTIYGYHHEAWTNSYANAAFEDVSTLSKGDVLIVSLSADYLPTTNNVGAGQVTFDESNNKMFLNAGTKLVKYSIPGNTIDTSVNVQYGISSHRNWRPIFEDTTSRIYIADGQYIKIYAASNLAEVDIINMANFGSGLNGQALVNATGEDKIVVCGKTKFGIFNPSTLEFDHTGSLNANEVNASPIMGVYSPTQGKCYFDTSKNGNPQIIAIDMSDYSVQYFGLGGTSSPNLNSRTSIAYDSVRDALWVMNKNRNITSVRCSDNQVTNYNTRFAGTWFGIMPTTFDNKAVIGSQVLSNTTKIYDLNDFWSI